jgi:multidrug efflux pump subunit AcrB
VATTIEQEINGVENMLYMSSLCGNDGVMQINVTFNLGTNLDAAQVLVQNRVAIAEPKLPEEVRRQGITTKKRSSSILLVVNMVTNVKDKNDPNYRTNLDLSNYAALYVKDELARIDGVGDVTFFGARDYSMRVWLNPFLMESRNLNVTDVVAALQQQNVQVAAGRIGQAPLPAGNEMQLSISTKGRLLSEEDFENVIIKTGEGGQILRLRDVARVELGAKNYDVSSNLDGKESVGLPIFQRPGSNALETAAQIKAKMQQLKQKFDPGYDYEIVYDTTVFIDESIAGVYHTLIEAFILVFLVVLIFLQDWRATILPMIDVPVSLIGTFGFMALFGFSLNNLTLFGLVLAIGIVVDDAIVVVENVETWLARGLNARDATLKAMSEVTGPIIAITLVLAAVFIPTAFIAGINGQFFRQFALTIAASTAISAMNAMTMTPSRTVQIFKHRVPGQHHQTEALPWWGIGAIIAFLTLFFFGELIMTPLGIHLGVHGSAHFEASPWYMIWGFRFAVLIVGLVIGALIHKPVNLGLGKFFKGFNWCFDYITAGYGKVVAGVMRISVVMLIVYVGLMVLTYLGFNRLPTGFIPEQDKGYLVVAADLPDGASLERTEKVMAELASLAAKDPAVAHTITVPGFSLFTGANKANAGTMFLTLKSFDERRGQTELGAATTIGRLYGTYHGILDARVMVLNAPVVDGIGNASGVKLQIKDTGLSGLMVLQQGMEALQVAARERGLPISFSTFRAYEPQLRLEIDRSKASAAGVQLEELFRTLQGYLGSLYVNDFTAFDRNWQVTLQADQYYRRSKDDIGKLKVRNKSGKMVPLDAVLTIVETTGPAQVSHYQLNTSADLNFVLMKGMMSTGQAIALLDELGKEHLPDKMTFDWTEISLQEVIAKNDLLSKLVFPLAVLFVYLVLAAQYESWIMPLAIILIVPMCILAAVAGLTWAGMDNNIFTQIGLVVLIALASKNAILIVEFAKQLQQQGKSLRDATLEACRLRLRPILMTSLAFILGVVPLVRASGAGAEMRIALGMAVLSGMIGVTFFGLFFTPVFNILLSKVSAYFDPPVQANETPSETSTAQVTSSHGK